MAVNNFDENFGNFIEKINSKAVIWGFIVYYALVFVAWRFSTLDKKDELTPRIINSDTVKALLVLPAILIMVLPLIILVFAEYGRVR
jgi:tellurite resistance protein TehA-like permease